MNFVYLKVLFAEPKNELSILSSISFSHYESQKNKIFENVFEFRQQICNENVINRVGVLINNPPAVQFSYKFEFILYKNWGSSNKDINQNSQLQVVHSVVWSVFPGIVLNQRIHFAILMLKSNFNFLGATKKWNKTEALGSNYTFKDGLAEYYIVCSNKCIFKSFQFLANSLDIDFTWTHCILMSTF